MKRRPFARLRRRWLPVAAALAGAALFLGNRGFRRLVSRELEIRRFRREIAGLDAEKIAITARIDAIKKGGPAFERAVRKELGYLKPGEVEYRFPPPGGKSE